MTLPKIRCGKCEQIFELLPDKPGKVDICASCSAPTKEQLAIAKQQADLPKIWARSASKASKSWSMKTHREMTSINRQNASYREVLRKIGMTDDEIDKSGALIDRTAKPQS